VIKIQKAVRGWLARKRFEKDLKDLLKFTGDEDLLKSTEELRRKKAAKIVFKLLYKHWTQVKRERKRQAAALKIQSFYRMHFVKNSSFVNALELARYPRIYFLKEQKPQFVKILRSQLPILTQEGLSYD
jgi:myosin heavy subunit